MNLYEIKVPVVALAFKKLADNIAAIETDIDGGGNWEGRLLEWEDDIYLHAFVSKSQFAIGQRIYEFNLFRDETPHPYAGISIIKCCFSSASTVEQIAVSLTKDIEITSAYPISPGAHLIYDTLHALNFLHGKLEHMC